MLGQFYMKMEVKKRKDIEKLSEEVSFSYLLLRTL